MMKKLLIIAVLTCIPGYLYAANSSYIPQGTIKDQLKEGIKNAGYGIDICMHDFAALDIANDLACAINRGVRLRAVILKYDTNASNGSLAESLIQKGFDVRVLKPQFDNNHVLDFMVFDDRVLVTGVYNWLAYRNRPIYNDVIFHYNPDYIHTHKTTFYQLFTEGEATPFTAGRKESDTTINSAVADEVPDATDTGQKEIVDTETEKPVKEAVPKDFIDISIEDMDKQVGKKSIHSRSQKNELWEKYRGKYVRWRGIVLYKGMGRVDWNRIGISRKKSKDAEVEIIFDWRMFDKVMNIREGSTITYTGRLVSRPGINSPYRLDDGDIE